MATGVGTSSVCRSADRYSPSIMKSNLSCEEIERLKSTHWAVDPAGVGWRRQRTDPDLNCPPEVGQTIWMLAPAWGAVQSVTVMLVLNKNCLLRIV